MAGSNTGIRTLTAVDGTGNIEPVTGTDIGSGTTQKRTLDVTNYMVLASAVSTTWQALDLDTTPDYTAGDQFGELLTVTSVPVRGWIVGLEIQDDDIVRPDLTAYFFGASPTIASSDNAALSLTEANLDFRVGRIRVRLGHWDGDSSTEHVVAQVNLPDSENGGPIPYQLDSGSSLFVLFQAAGTINIATAGAIRVRFKIIGA